MVAAHSVAGPEFPPLVVDLKLENSGIRDPVLIDVLSGEITALAWKQGTTDTLSAVPVRDSILAIADASYFDWPVLPEAPSDLAARSASGAVELHWALHGGSPSKVTIERRVGNTGAHWERIATESGTQFNDTSAPRSAVVVCYRVRAINAAGESAYCNIARAGR